MQRKVLRKKIAARFRRHQSIRKSVSGNAQRPRLCVFRSLREIYGSLVDDSTGCTLLTESTLSLRKKGTIPRGSNKAAAKAVGMELGKKALEKDIKEVVFDRSGYKYHGRVKSLADGAREAGLKF